MLLLSIFVTVILILFLVWYKPPEVEATKDKIEFIENFRFEEPPSEIDINNPDDCMGEKKCDITDPLSCVGCKSLLSSCVHLDEDRKVILYDNTEIILPKNDSPNEGYCLQIRKLADTCSAQGDLCFVSASPDDYLYQLLCVCKNPGLIGNDTILGNCSTVYMCGGNIDSIEKPIESINCECSDSQISDRLENGVPYCREKIITEDISEALDKTLKSQNLPLLAIEHFDKNIAQNIPNYKELTDPCGICPITNKPVYAKFTTDQGFSFCAESFANNQCAIVKVDPDGGNNLATLVPTAVLALNWTSVVVLVGQNKINTTFYRIEKSKQNDSRFDFLFGPYSDIYLECAGNLPGFNLVRGFKIEDLASNDYSSYFASWDLRVGPYSSGSYSSQTSKKYGNLTIHYTSYGCPWAFHVGCEDWDSSYSNFGMLEASNNIMYTTDYGLISKSKYFKSYGAIGYTLTYDNGKLVARPIRLKGDAGEWIHNRMMSFGKPDSEKIEDYTKRVVNDV